MGYAQLHGTPRHPSAPPRQPNALKCLAKTPQNTRAPARFAGHKPLQGQQLHRSRCHCHCHHHHCHCHHSQCTRCPRPHLPRQIEWDGLAQGGCAPSETSPSNNSSHSPPVGGSPPPKHQQCTVMFYLVPPLSHPNLSLISLYSNLTLRLSREPLDNTRQLLQTH